MINGEFFSTLENELQIKPKEQEGRKEWKVQGNTSQPVWKTSIHPPDRQQFLKWQHYCE